MQLLVTEKIVSNNAHARFLRTQLLLRAVVDNNQRLGKHHAASTRQSHSETTAQLCQYEAILSFPCKYRRTQHIASLSQDNTIESLKRLEPSSSNACRKVYVPEEFSFHVD